MNEADASRFMAREWLASNPLFLDTETTGLDATAEVLEVAVVDAGGSVLLNTLVCPSRREVPAEATAVHGISYADVITAHSFNVVAQQLSPVIAGRLVIIYNADFDMRLLQQSARAAGMLPAQLPIRAACAMELYAAYYGDWSEWHGNYRWQRLEDAARQCGLQWDAAAHRALADAQMCRKIVCHVSAERKLE